LLLNLGLAGLVGGLAGGVVVAVSSQTAGGPPSTATRETSPTAAAGDEWTALQGSIDRTLPAIVTIIADLPARGGGEDAVQTRNLGSGIVIDDVGHVVTNYHVVEGAEGIAVALATGEQRPARVVGDDSPFTDLAVLQVPALGLRSTKLVPSRDVHIGEPVVALGGSAIAGQNSASFGIVSGVRRTWPRPSVTLEDLLQTDAAVNHGDSGGALMTRAGIVGLLTTVVRETPNGLPIAGVSFAQSTDSLQPAIESIVRTGRFPRARLGIERLDQHIEVTPAVAARGQLPVSQGALVTAVAPNSPAGSAGVLVGDIIVGLNGVQIDLDTPLVNLLKAVRPGTRVDLALVRAGQPTRISVATAGE
jgi:serine protease DegQ